MALGKSLAVVFINYTWHSIPYHTNSLMKPGKSGGIDEHQINVPRHLQIGFSIHNCQRYRWETSVILPISSEQGGNSGRHNVPPVLHHGLGTDPDPA